MEKTKEYDPQELIAGTVESIREKFEHLDDKGLTALHGFEEAREGGPRSTLLDAIHVEQAARTDVAKAKAAEAAAAKEGGRPPAGADAKTQLGPADGTDPRVAAAERAQAAPPTERSYTQEEVDRLIAERDATHAADKKLAVENAKAGTNVKATAPKGGKPLKIADKAEAVALHALTGPSQIVFVDDEDVPIAALPKLAFGSGDYRPEGDGVVLDKEIDFPTSVQQSDVAGAFLMDGNSPVAKAMLVMPFNVGGGRAARLPARTLVFQRRHSIEAAGARTG